jgi:hypothetical protein
MNPILWPATTSGKAQTTLSIYLIVDSEPNNPHPAFLVEVVNIERRFL